MKGLVQVSPLLFAILAAAVLCQCSGVDIFLFCLLVSGCVNVSAYIPAVCVYVVV